MISVEEAHDRLLQLVPAAQPETVDLKSALGRVLLNDAVSQRTQPPFAASAMDGYAIADLSPPSNARYRVIGESRAGEGFRAPLAAGEAVRIFTGAPVPESGARVIIQEDVERSGDQITLKDSLDTNPYIRPAGGDFVEGDRLTAPRALTAREIGLLAAMNIPQVTVAKRPVVALIATGDELVEPGQSPGPDQIVSSNAHALAALVEASGATVRRLPIARDTRESLTTAFELAKDADVIVTLGGASVGEHDLVSSVGQEVGLTLDFYKIAMRPGKPLMAGKLGAATLLGLPGNPVSAYVCGVLFLQPMLKAAQGLADTRPKLRPAVLSAPLPRNGPREHYMRGTMTEDAPFPSVAAQPKQDSSLMSVLARSDVLIKRAPHDPERQAGEEVMILDL